MKNFQNQIVDRAGREQTVEAAEKPESRAICQGNIVPLFAHGEPDSGEGSKEIGGDEKIGDVATARLEPSLPSQCGRLVPLRSELQAYVGGIKIGTKSAQETRCRNRADAGTKC